MVTVKIDDKELKKLSARGGITCGEFQALIQDFIERLLVLFAKCTDGDGDGDGTGVGTTPPGNLPPGEMP